MQDYSISIPRSVCGSYFPVQKYVAYSASVSSDAAGCSSFSELHLCKPEPGTRMRCCRAACVGPECFADGSGGFYAGASFLGARVVKCFCAGQGRAASKLFTRGARSCCTRAVKCSLRGRGVSHVESLHGERGCVRGPRARRLERQVLLFPFVCACRVLASGCVLAKGKAGSGGGEKRQPEDRAAFGLSSRAGARYFVSRIRATMSRARARHGSHTACE